MEKKSVFLVLDQPLQIDEASNAVIRFARGEGNVAFSSAGLPCTDVEVSKMRRFVLTMCLSLSLASLPATAVARGGVSADLVIAESESLTLLQAAVYQAGVDVGLANVKLGKDTCLEVFYVPESCDGAISYTGARYVMPPSESADPKRNYQWIASGQSVTYVDLDRYSEDSTSCTFKVYVRARSKGRYWDHAIDFFTVSR